jgi:hypothetical protein
LPKTHDGNISILSAAAQPAHIAIGKVAFDASTFYYHYEDLIDEIAVLLYRGLICTVRIVAFDFLHDLHREVLVA